MDQPTSSRPRHNDLDRNSSRKRERREKLMGLQKRMALIQEESSDDKNLQSHTKPPAFNDSDGYATATDTEPNDVVPESDNHSHNIGPTNDDANEEHEHKCESSDNVLNQKPLTAANDAKVEGNSLFKDGLYEEALSKYEFAIQIAPDGPSSAYIRSMCYANRAACFSNLGKFDETIKECTKAIELNPTYIKALLRRGEAHEKLQHYDESIADMTKILELDQSNEEARRTIIHLKPLAEAKREKMKEEMIGKLKEMGDSILGRFGMSVDNFKAVKDPKTGSYSISFQQ